VGEVLKLELVQLEMKRPERCKIACLKKMKKDEAAQFAAAIDEDYRVHWCVSCKRVCYVLIYSNCTG
jgi:hypothetical protein